MSGSSVLWAETPHDDGAEQAPDSEVHGHVDESFAARRLRRWIRGMFGGGEKPPAADGEAVRPQSGPEEGAPGEPGGSPGESQDR